MPRYKTDTKLIKIRDDLGYPDTLTVAEVDDIIRRAGKIDYILPPAGWQCLFSLFRVYGKRVGEVCRILLADIKIDDEFLSVTFTIEKKIRQIPNTDKIKYLPNRYTKRISLNNPFVMHYILPFLNNRPQYITDRLGGSKFLFPCPRVDKPIYPKYVWDAINRMGFKQPIWSHLFRHTLATELAGENISTFELKSWFDWESIVLADKYVSRAGVLTDKISRR